MTTPDIKRPSLSREVDILVVERAGEERGDVGIPWALGSWNLFYSTILGLAKIRSDWRHTHPSRN